MNQELSPAAAEAAVMLVAGFTGPRHYVSHDGLENAFVAAWLAHLAPLTVPETYSALLEAFAKSERYMAAKAALDRALQPGGE